MLKLPEGIKQKLTTIKAEYEYQVMLIASSECLIVCSNLISEFQSHSQSILVSITSLSTLEAI